MYTDIYRAARLAYRLGRQDQQRILEHRLRKHFDSDVQAKQIRDIAAGACGTQYTQHCAGGPPVQCGVCGYRERRPASTMVTKPRRHLIVRQTEGKR